jgi:hypothetical protein
LGEAEAALLELVRLVRAGFFVTVFAMICLSNVAASAALLGLRLRHFLLLMNVRQVAEPHPEHRCRHSDN